MDLTATSEKAFLKQARVALLTNVLGPHSLPFCECVTEAVPHFRVFTSAEVDDFHGFPRDWGIVKVTVMRSFNQLRIRRRAYGFWQSSELHIPYDTYQHLKAFSPDIILSNQLGIRTLFAALYTMRHPRVKLILCATLSDHSESKRSWPRRLLRKWLITHLDGAFVNGRGSETYLRRLGFQGPTFTVPYTIRAAPFETSVYCPAPSRFRLLYAGMLIPQKGLMPFAKVLTKWCEDHPETDVSFTLVGDGPEAGRLNKLLTPDTLMVEVLPKMDRSKLVEQYWNSDIFAFPTLGDEWGVVVNESMIAGRPVLGSIYSQSATELILEGENGWLFDPNDPGSIYDALNRAFSRTVEELQTMSGKARDAVRHLTPEQVADTALHAMHSVYNGEIAPS